DFPTTAIQAAPGGIDAFVVVFSEGGNPVPTLTSLSPAAVTAAAPAFSLNVFGFGFAPGAVVRWNGADRVTTFLSNVQLTAAIPASDVAVVSTAQVTVFNPAPGGGLSNALTFTIGGNPVPVISVIAPAGAAAGGADFALGIVGSGFIAGSVV